MLSILAPRFGTRSAARDVQTDMERMMTVRRAIQGAIASATREHDGLRHRVDAYYAQAATVLDNSGDYAGRSGADEEIVRTAERNAATATARLHQVRAQIVHLSGLLAQLDALPAGAA